MALADSGRAIGAVTRLLRDHLIRGGFEVSVGKPETAADINTTAKLNLFLYETVFDPTLKNFSLDNSQPAPLWLVLKYLLTAFDDREESDSPTAHELLGQGLSALQELNFLHLDPLVAPDVQLALENNPEPLKLTFDESSVDLLSKIMQGTDEHYRLSVAFQMRPIMIVPSHKPRASLLVGINYTTTPQTVIGDEGIDITVLPSLGPRLERVEPAAFEVGAQIELFGDDLNTNDLEVVLGNVVLTPVERLPDRLRATVEGDPGANPEGPIASGTALSAGELPLIVRRRLSPTRTRSSNLLAARLLPTLSTATVVANDLVLTGLLLGEDSDDVMVYLYHPDEGVTVRAFDTGTTGADQQNLTVAGAAVAVPAGSYRVILQVNNQQAKISPMVTVP
jgi:hypothetical protein